MLGHERILTVLREGESRERESTKMDKSNKMHAWGGIYSSGWDKAGIVAYSLELRLGLQQLIQLGNSDMDCAYNLSNTNVNTSCLIYRIEGGLLCRSHHNYYEQISYFKS